MSWIPVTVKVRTVVAPGSKSPYRYDYLCARPYENGTVPYEGDELEVDGIGYVVRETIWNYPMEKEFVNSCTVVVEKRN